jgi:hypothetical protein
LTSLKQWLWDLEGEFIFSLEIFRIFKIYLEGEEWNRWSGMDIYDLMKLYSKLHLNCQLTAIISPSNIELAAVLNPMMLCYQFGWFYLWGVSRKCKTQLNCILPIGTWTICIEYDKRRQWHLWKGPWLSFPPSLK